MNSLANTYFLIFKKDTGINLGHCADFKMPRYAHFKSVSFSLDISIKIMCFNRLI